MSGHMVQTKRGFESEEQKYSQASKKLCREQLISSQYYDSQALSSHVLAAHRHGQEVAETFDSSSESWYGGTILTGPPEADTIDFTTYFEHGPTEIPQVSPGMSITHQGIELKQSRFMSMDQPTAGLWTQMTAMPQMEATPTDLDVPVGIEYKPKYFQPQHHPGVLQQFEQAEEEFHPCEENQISSHVEVSQPPLAGLETESQRQPREFPLDTCFGVIATKPSVSPHDRTLDKPEAVTLSAPGPIFKMYYGDSGKYVGLVVMSALNELLVSYRVKLKAFLSQVKPEEPLVIGKRGQSSRNEQPEYSLRIVIFGSGVDKTAVGDFLSSSELYLQHPSGVECDLSVNYFNPHYLVRAGGEMPRIEELSLTEDVEEETCKTVQDDVAKNRLRQTTPLRPP
ncbi:hypothetical protein F4803DRAFT_519320 [Xylaria telfairii]|nr:hypothetical protein F4803DRAFT_519320 [Xylaria telfairii]